MDHSMHTGMSMAPSTIAAAVSGTASAASGMAMPSSTGMSMSGGGGHGGMGGGCKISMLWNWYTVDSCFIARSWHITSRGMFAGSCIGVILLVMLLELLRRAGKEYDRYLLAQHTASQLSSSASPDSSSASGSTTDGTRKGATATAVGNACTTNGVGSKSALFRPNVFQQAIRAFLHMAQFAVAYFVMLLAMYYNGYIIICIFIGAYIGYFVFGWETLGRKDGRLEEEVTVCCG